MYVFKIFYELGEDRAAKRQKNKYPQILDSKGYARLDVEKVHTYVYILYIHEYP